MARLIDADALMYSIRHAIYPSDMTTTVAVGICESHVKDAPTIDAIPLQWLNNKMLDLQNRDKALSRAAWLVLYEWQKEQEAR